MPSSATVTSHELDSADRTANRHSFKVMVTRSMKRTCDKRCFRRAVQILFLSAVTVVSCARGTSFRPARLDFFGKRTRTAVEVARTRPIVACWVLRTNTPDGLARSFAIRRGWGKSCDYLEFIDDATPGIEMDWVEKYEDISAKSYRAWEFMYDKYVNISQTDTTMVDFVLKADVDTYIIWKNALTFLRRFDSALPHYIGRELVDPRDGAFVAGTAWGLLQQPRATRGATRDMLMRTAVGKRAVDARAAPSASNTRAATPVVRSPRRPWQVAGRAATGAALGMRTCTASSADAQPAPSVFMT